MDVMERMGEEIQWVSSIPAMHIFHGQRHVYAWVAVQKRGKSIREMRRR